MLAVQIIMLPPLICGALSDESDICLSVAYNGSKSRTERPRKTNYPSQCILLLTLLCLAPSIKRSCDSDVCLPVVYMWSKPRTERPGKTKIGTEAAHVTLDSVTTFEVKRARSPGCFG